MPARERSFEDSPGFEKRLDSVSAIFTADAGVFESSPGCLRIIRHTVDHDASGTYLRGYTTRAREVGPKDRGVETIFRIVGDPDRLVLGVISNDGQDGAENLLLGNCHIVLHIDKHRGLHEVTGFETFRMTLTTDKNLHAFFDALADIRLHLFVLFLRHHRSDGGLGISRITDWEGRHGVDDCSLDLVEPALRHEEARPCGARLTAVHEGHDEGRRDRLVENGVIEQDRRRLAAQFQRHALHGFRPVAHDRFANANRPCERDLGDIGVTYQLGADDIAAPRDHVQETLREIGLVQRLDQHPSLARAQLPGLNYARTAA